MENKINLGTVTLGNKGDTLAGKKIDLNFQIKLTLNPNEEVSAKNVKVEVLDDSTITNIKQKVDKLNIDDLRIDEVDAPKFFKLNVDPDKKYADGFQPEMKVVSSQKLKQRCKKFGFVNEDESDEEEENDDELRVDYSAVKENLEKDKLNTSNDDNEED